MMFIEQRHETVKVSFRSRATVDVDKIAEQFASAGGHSAKAARGYSDQRHRRRASASARGGSASREIGVT